MEGDFPIDLIPAGDFGLNSKQESFCFKRSYGFVDMKDSCESLLLGFDFFCIWFVLGRPERKDYIFREDSFYVALATSIGL